MATIWLRISAMFSIPFVLSNRLAILSSLYGLFGFFLRAGRSISDNNFAQAFQARQALARSAPAAQEAYSITIVTVFEVVPAAVTTTLISPAPAKLRGSGPMLT